MGLVLDCHKTFGGGGGSYSFHQLYSQKVALKEIINDLPPKKTTKIPCEL